MTRKCVLCKETNYKNTYSFFSAPKDPETRKKWQDAIAIDNYAVGDDTYVCSKHFHKNDIITHWVSGIPPHVITIKYKKCRLRPGAVPGRYHHAGPSSLFSKLDNSNLHKINTTPLWNCKKEETQINIEKKGFLIPREKDTSDDMSNDSNVMNYRTVSNDEDYMDTYHENKHLDVKRLSTDTINDILSFEDSKSNLGNHPNEISKPSDKTMSKKDHINVEVVFVNKVNIGEIKEQDKSSNKVSCTKIVDRSLDYFPRSSDMLSEQDTQTKSWKQRAIKSNSSTRQKCTNNTLQTIEDLYVKNCTPNALNYDEVQMHDYPVYHINRENELLFEDLLEMCTEIILPRGWSCIVTSKGHSTTIVYLYMGITKNALPFVKKQVFLQSDMILRCAATNKEINPLIHNLVREGKHLKVQSLLDIEELIDEFDQRTVCEGTYNDNIQEINTSKIAYKDGIKWRHVSCPLIINNDSSRCTKCIALSYLLTRKSKKLLSFPYSSIIFLKKRKKRLHYNV